MKRRLDLALALVHRPRVLFLDEPTTGLDVQSRTALWEEVGAARARGRRDRLPHDAVPRGGRRARRPRRDHRPRPDRRRGHAGRAQGRGRPADRRGGARRPGRPRPARPRSSRRFGEPCRATHGVAVRLRSGDDDLAERRARARRRGPRSREPPAPPADARRRLPREDRPLARGRRRGEDEAAQSAASRWSRREPAPSPTRSSSSRARSVVRTLAPAGERDRAARLPAAAARGELRRAEGRDAPARLPDATRSSPSRSRCRSSRARCSRR